MLSASSILIRDTIVCMYIGCPHPYTCACVLFPTCRYAIMRSCWASKPEDRPMFSTLVQQVGRHLSNKASYLDLHAIEPLATADNLSGEAESCTDPSHMLHILHSLIPNPSPGLAEEGPTNSVESGNVNSHCEPKSPPSIAASATAVLNTHASEWGCENSDSSMNQFHSHVLIPKPDSSKSELTNSGYVNVYHV